MPTVKTLRPHHNIHGIHDTGDRYEHDRPGMDIKFGYVELVTGEPTIEELKAEAERRNIELPTTGSGKDSRVIKADIRKAIDGA